MKLQLTAQYLLGLVDSEGMFGLIVHKGGDPTGNKFGLEFKITQKDHSLYVLEAIKDYFGCGRIAIDNRKDGTYKFVVTDILSIVNILIPFFLTNQLNSSKHLNFTDFARMAEIINSGAHLTIMGAQELLAIYSGMNSKRSWTAKYLFMANHSICITAGWLQGFIDGDGSFTTGFYLSSATRTTRHMMLQLFLEIKQSSHDAFLLQAIITYLGVGQIKPKYDINNLDEVKASRSQSVLVVRQTSTIIDFVDTNPMMTRKHLDYLCWKELYELRECKIHLTPEGIQKVKDIQSRMNSKRV